ncbi:MFS transporter [Streptomyces sp. NPDC046759]|uniref:MFS transporter n=1 Tax=Streptomyces sp. NPDC046759 TaxID=3155019 RepID=UPI003408AD29
MSAPSGEPNAQRSTPTATPPAPGSAPPVRAPADRTVTVLALVLLAVNLRLVLAGVSPLLPEIRHARGLSTAGSGALTTVPVLCLGLLAPAAPALAARFGAPRVLLGCLTGLAAGAALRCLPGSGWLFAGTVLAGCCIAVANVLLPSVVRGAFPDRIGTLTGVSTMLVSGGAALAAGGAAALERTLGGDWRPALAVWAVPALAAAALWVRPSRRTGRPATLPGPAGRPHGPSAGHRLRRSGLAWQLTLFMGLQSLLAYALMAWLPQFYRDQGESAAAAGGVLAVLSLASIPSSLLVPMVAARVRGQAPVALAVVLCSAAGLTGLLLAPVTGALVWAVLLGLGQGGELGLALTLINLRSSHPAQTAALSGMAQSVGYCLAACGPLSLGVLHDATGGWTWPLTALLLLTLPLTVTGMGAGRSPATRSAARLPR